jgi:4-hydroxy-tetrahydrodipicolinate synthase
MAEHLTKEDLRGVIPPIVSTFDDNGELDLGLFEREIEFMRLSGIEVVLVGGSTGEGASLTPEELATLARVAADGGLRVIAGIITTNTRDAATRAVLASAAGASALLVAPPIYVRPSDVGLETYVADIAEAGRLPILFYNHFFYEASVVRRIAELPVVIGVKEASVDVIGELVQVAGDHITVAAGIDPTPLAGLVLGADAVIAGVNAVAPSQAMAVYEAFAVGDLGLARDLLQRIAPLARLMTEPVDFPAAVKFAINAAGRDVGRPRLPFQPVSSEKGGLIREALRYAGILDLASVV